MDCEESCTRRPANSPGIEGSRWRRSVRRNDKLLLCVSCHIFHIVSGGLSSILSSMQRTLWIALLQPLLIVLFFYTSMCNFQLSPGGICTQQVTGATLSRKVRWYWIGQGSQPIHWSSFPNGSSSFGASKIPRWYMAFRRALSQLSPEVLRFTLCLCLTLMCITQLAKKRESVAFARAVLFSSPKKRCALLFCIHNILYLLTHITAHDSYRGHFIHQTIEL